MSISSAAIWAAAPTTTRGQPTPLSSDSKGERIVYASGKSIFVRSIDDPSVGKQYTEHTAQTTVARFAPSGFYVASGDVTGSVRVWDCVGEGITKGMARVLILRATGEYHIIAGRINDLAWDGDSQRIIAVGDGKEKFGHCITADSGNSVGEISGHSSQINCVAVRQQRPLRAATGSDDTSMVFYHGAPFKFNTSLRGQHNRFIYGTAFSPDGNTLVTVGADKKIWLYDGKTGEAKGQIGEGVHTGSIFAVSWASDSKRFVTASADQTVRIWEAESGQNLKTWRMGEEGVVSVSDQQVGVTWPAGRSDGLIISLDLEGNLNYLYEDSDKPKKVVRGHSKNTTAAGISGNTLFTGSYDGRVRAWDLKTGLADAVDGESHTNYVAGFSGATQDSSDAQIYSIGWDDTMRCISTNAKAFAGSKTELGSQPKGVATATVNGKTTTLVALAESIALYTDGQKTGEVPTKYAPTSIAAFDTTVAVGGDDAAVHIYTLSDSSTLTHTGADLRNSTTPIATLAFSPRGTYLAAGSTGGKVHVYNPSEEWKLVTDRWSAHTARITALAWDEEEKRCASGSLDTSVFVWSIKEPGKRVKVLNAHKEGVSGVAWVEGGMVVSTGGDATVKVWKVEGVN
ncbi:WD40 repeat-like protein [Saccharata proteae CBS 121410]|uniref:WD40 repeat-like protein n=1 Tax=Saccharata proteae CBS 121410 TaxID=1314787 RepID=A0A9P4HUY3_9PEZI|nr:WD40 repeat-like protein [Saccharata proteae CBS 121410]